MPSRMMLFGLLSLALLGSSVVTAQLCPHGQGINDKGECKPCGPGFRSGSVMGQGSTSFCIPCFPGQYASGHSNTECKNCDHDEYSVGFGYSKCSKCPHKTKAGPPTHFGPLGMTGPSTCVDEHNRVVVPPAPAHPAATSCPVGTGMDDDKCKKCPAGAVSIMPGSPAALANSRFLPQYFGVLCFPCRPGYHAKGKGNEECEICPAGTHAPNFFMDTCIKCPHGMTSEPGSSYCVPVKPVVPVVPAHGRRFL